MLVGVGAAVGSAHKRRRQHCSRWLQPTQEIAASAWCRSTGCRDWRLHRVVHLGWAVCWAVGKGVARVLWEATFWFCYPEGQKRVLSGTFGGLPPFPTSPDLWLFFLPRSRVEALAHPTALSNGTSYNDSNAPCLHHPITVATHHIWLVHLWN